MPAKKRDIAAKNKDNEGMIEITPDDPTSELARKVRLSMPSVREDLVREIKQKIKSGQYNIDSETLAQDVISHLANKVSGTPMKTQSQPLEDLLNEIHASVPEEDWDSLPTDLSHNHDHYIYGTNK